MTLPYARLLVPLGHEQPEGVCSNSRTATTSPANSWPGMIGKGVGGNGPAAMLRSGPQMPAARPDHDFTGVGRRIGALRRVGLRAFRR